MGVAIVTCPRILIAAAMRIAGSALGALREPIDSGAVIDRSDWLGSFGEINDLMGLRAIVRAGGPLSVNRRRERKYSAGRVKAAK